MPILLYIFLKLTDYFFTPQAQHISTPEGSGNENRQRPATLLTRVHKLKTLIEKPSMGENKPKPYNPKPETKPTLKP